MRSLSIIHFSGSRLLNFFYLRQLMYYAQNALSCSLIYHKTSFSSVRSNDFFKVSSRFWRNPSCKCHSVRCKRISALAGDITVVVEGSCTAEGCPLKKGHFCGFPINDLEKKSSKFWRNQTCKCDSNLARCKYSSTHPSEFWCYVHLKLLKGAVQLKDANCNTPLHIACIRYTGIRCGTRGAGAGPPWSSEEGGGHYLAE